MQPCNVEIRRFFAKRKITPSEQLQESYMCHRFISRSPLLVLIFSYTAAQFAVAQPATVKLWAVSDGVRVNPVTGNLIESRTSIHKDYPVGDFSAGNSVWDAAAKRVSLVSARNEFASFQLIIEASQPASDVDVNFSEVRHSSGRKIDGKYLQLFKEGDVSGRRALAGYETNSLGPGMYGGGPLAKARAHLSSGFPLTNPGPVHNIPEQKDQANLVGLFFP